MFLIRQHFTHYYNYDTCVLIENGNISGYNFNFEIFAITNAGIKELTAPILGQQ